jgi:hypothetical protein
MVADLQMQVGCLVFDRAPEKIINADGHVSVHSAKLQQSATLASGIQAGKQAAVSGCAVVT